MMKNILAQLTHAYNRDKYSTLGWEHCARLLKSKGLTDKEIVAFMDSKHMRWAVDTCKDTIAHGHHGAETLSQYLEAYPKYLIQDELDFLTGE